MALIVFDRVKETSNTAGTGTIVLAGAVSGYQSFAVVGNTNTTYYTIADQTGSNWEVGIGTYYTSNVSLSRDTVLASSNANAAVTFGSNTKDVFVTYPAEKAVYANNSPTTSGYVLTANGTGVPPTWSAVSGGSAASYTRTSFTATAGQTTFSVTYVVGYVAVYLNGVFLNGTDYTATNGTTVVLAVAANLNDIVETVAYNATSIAVAGGSNTQIQYNNNGNLAGSSNLVFDGTTLTAANIASSAMTLTGKQIFNFSGDEQQLSLDTSIMRTGSWSVSSSGTLYALVGEPIMWYWIHNCGINSSTGDFLARDDYGPVTLWALTESMDIKTWVSAPSQTLSAPTGWVLTGTQDTNNGIFTTGGLSGNALKIIQVSTPAAAVGTGSATGGTLSAGNYYVKVVGLDINGNPTAPSAESTVVTTTGTTSSINYIIPATPGVNSYQIYVTQTSGTYTSGYFTYSPDYATNYFTLTTLTGTTAGTIPSINTTGVVLAPNIKANGNTAGSSNVGAISYGNLSYTDVNHLATFQSAVDSYSQIEIQNTNNTTSASSDVIVANNQTTASTFYGDFGMNSGAWTGTPGTSSLTAPNMVYLTSTSADLTIGTTTSNVIRFVTNGGADKLIFDASGNVGIGLVPTGLDLLELGAGTTAKAPLGLTSGSLITSPDNGSIEYDGNNLYFTPDTSQLRVVIGEYQQFYLSANVSALTGATQNFFGSTSAASLAAASTYDIDCHCYFLKTTAGTVQWIPTFSSAIAVGHSYLEYTPVTGFTTTVITGAMVVSEATQQTTTVLTHTATASLTTAVFHIAKLRIRVTTTLACNFRLNNTIGTGTITPQTGSWYTVRKVVTNSGNFVA